jgi:hypothetical protein
MLKIKAQEISMLCGNQIDRYLRIKQRKAKSNQWLFVWYVSVHQQCLEGGYLNGKDVGLNYMRNLCPCIIRAILSSDSWLLPWRNNSVLQKGLDDSNQ